MIRHPLPPHPDTWPEGTVALWLAINDGPAVKVTREEALAIHDQRNHMDSLAGPTEPPLEIVYSMTKVVFYIAGAQEPFLRLPYAAYRPHDTLWNDAIRQAIWVGRKWQARADGAKLTEG